MADHARDHAPDVLTLAGDFPTPTRADWDAAAEASLRGKPLASLIRTTYEGIGVAPLYTREDVAGLTTSTPIGTRGATTWGFRQLHRHPDLATANAQILIDLEGGVTELTIRFDRATRAGLDPDHEEAADLVADDGTSVATYADLDRLLDGVLLDLAPVHLEPGAAFLPAAAALAAVIEERNLPASAVRGGFGADPIGNLATTGALPQGLDDAWDQLADLAAYTDGVLPNIRAIRVSTQPYVSAGASDAQELAAALATGVQYLRVLHERGLDLSAALRQIEFSLTASPDQFATIAKLRAFRRLWARVAEACGADDSDRAAQLHVTVADRALTRRDPWVNLLRGTVACFAAAVAGADSVTVPAFDDALGQPDELGRRIARNTQLILAEESYLDRVADPSAGSWYVEQRSEDLAEVAWEHFQALEEEGGIVAGLLGRAVHNALEATHEQRAADIVTRRAPLTGVTEYPDLDAAPLSRPTADLAAARTSIVQRLQTNRTLSSAPKLPAAGAGTLTSAVVDAVLDGASFGQIVAATCGAPLTVMPLPVHRLAESVEHLRDLSDAHTQATGDEPTIFLANLGALAEHTARAGFAANLFAVGGIRATSNDGYATAQEAADAFTASGATIACICGTDARYADEAASVAKALRAAGAGHIVLAGRQPDEPYPDIDAYVHVGCDVLAAVTAALQALEVEGA